MSPRALRFRSCFSHTLTGTVALLIFAAPAPARADEETPDLAADQARADEVAALLDTAVERFAAGDLETAREAFAAAWRLRKDVTIASNLADVEMRLGHYRDAAEHLSFCVRRATDESVRKDALRRLAECRPFVGNVTVRVDTLAATVLLDGAPVGHAPLEAELWLSPGTHTLQAQHQGRSSPAQTLQVRGGEELRIELKLAANVVKTAPPSATARRTSSSVARERTPAGETHRSDSLNEDFKFYSILGGSFVGATALGAGLLWTFSANSKEDTANALQTKVRADGDPELAESNGSCSKAASSPPADCGELKQAWASADRSRNLATGAFITGGVLVAGTVAAYFLWPDHHAQRRSSKIVVAPWNQGKANGVQLSGSF